MFKAFCVQPAHVSLREEKRDPFTGTPGRTVKMRAPGFWPLQRSAGLMSGRKQGFPPSLQEKKEKKSMIQFDDTLECNKLSCFKAVHTGKLYSHLVISFPLRHAPWSLFLSGF